MAGRADVERDIVAPGDLDHLVADLERDRRALEQVVGRVRRIDLLLEQVLHVRADVRGAPGDPLVVAEDDGRDAREAHPDDVVAAGRTRAAGSAARS